MMGFFDKLARHSARFYALRTSGTETDFFHKLSCIYSLF